MSDFKVIKIGGNVINHEEDLFSFLKSFSNISGKKVLIHGGGTLATQMANKLGIEQQMIDGRRVTDIETLKIVTMVYAGFANKNIVAQLQSLGCNAIGICGADGHIIQAHKRKSTIDYGYVGDIDSVDAQKIISLLSMFDTVVIAPITLGNDGQLLNTNADTIAQEVAKALAQQGDTELYYSFEKNGVLENVEDPNSVISTITQHDYTQLKAEGKIFAGMIPKLDNAFTAIHSGVSAVYIGAASEILNLTLGTKGTKIIA